ncbi:hypothetical protein KR222_011837 [Zaprionus bogoriensis]|nr:hypothetical protein KR222_011837 [Zaprionus bogoriensis]
MDLGDANLRPLRVLGSGSFGRIFLCAQREGRQQRNVCVKRIITKNTKNELALIKEEIYILSQLKHPNIVQFIRHFLHAGTVNIVMEYAANGTMRNVIHQVRSQGGLEQTRLLRYFGDMIMGLEYLHIRHVIHRDIKPENILLDAHDRVKFADFGISNIHTPGKQTPWHVMGTPLYMAPEVMRGSKCCFKSDIWSLGLVLFELCVGRNPFISVLDAGAQYEQKHVHRVIKSMTRPKLDCQLMRPRYAPSWARLCEAMVVYDREQRICLPDLFCLDAHITLHLYRQYFDYKH